jgi:hypothetical protein
MKTKAAVLYAMGWTAPYHHFAPLTISGDIHPYAVRQLIGFEA